MYDKLVRLSIGKDFTNFLPYTIKFSQIPSIVCSSDTMYSPVQFKDYRRKSANYLRFADFLVLDFDEGWTKELDDFFNQFIGYKVPTKSHLKDKNGIVCERYRIILLLQNSINLDTRGYKRLYKHIIKDLKLPADTACVDTARFYYSAYQPVEHCIELKGTQFFPWEKFNYKDIEYASIIQNDYIDLEKYKDLDLSYLADLNPSKRYPCPICQLEGFDQKGHHLGFNKDKDYPSCFFDESHNKILRKLYKQCKYGNIQSKEEEIKNMVKQKCTPDLIKVGRNIPHPTNYADSLYDFYDKALDMIETDDIVDLDIETFSEYYVDETLEECEARLGADYKYIKGAYNSKCNEYAGVALDPFKNKIRIITLGGGGAVCPFDMYYAKPEQVQRILNIIHTKLCNGHNIKFDLKSIAVSYGEQYLPDYCFDTMIASRMIHMALDPEDQQSGHNLETTAFRFLDYKMDKHVEHTWGNDNLSPRQLQYAGNDVEVLRPIMKEQIRQFKEIYGPFDIEHYDINELEFLGPLVKEHPILALEMQTLLEVIRIEHTGVKTNIPMMEKMIDFYNDSIDKYDNELGINCGSSKQCVEFLQKYVNPQITSSDRGTLAQYAEKYPSVQKIIDSKAYRTRRGLMESMSNTNIHPYDGRVHATFNQLLSTGRFACKEPNMQQIPRDIKNDVYMSEKDQVIYDTDYAAVELRLATVVSGDPIMLDAYRKNTDMHYLTASLLFKKEIPHTPEEKEDAEKNPNTKFLKKWERGFGKHCNFSLIYGSHWTSFVAMTQAQKLPMTEQQAHDYYDLFFETYKGLDQMIKNAKAVFMTGCDKEIPRWVRFKNGSLHKMTKTVPFFTQCRTLIGRCLTADTERKLMNYPVQGSGSDAIKLGICKLGYNTRKDKTSHRTINLVHDDTIGQCDIRDFDINSKYFREALEWSVNYVLRRQFYTPVDQDFCVLSMFGEEIFLEKARTVEEIKEGLYESMKHHYDLLQKSQQKLIEEQEDIDKDAIMKDIESLTNKLNAEHRVYTKLLSLIDNNEIKTL